MIYLMNVSKCITFISNPQVCHLAEIEEDAVARVLSWHMSSDMDCVITKTTEKAKQVHSICAGRQQVMAIDSIFTRNLPDQNK